MSSTARDTAPPPSGRSVLALGLLMSASASFQLTEFVQVSLTPSWLLPVLAAWLAQRHGVAVLRDAWPLVVLPTLGVTFGHGIGFSFGISSATLLLALVVAAAADARLRLPPSSTGYGATPRGRQPRPCACWSSPRWKPAHGG